MEFFYLCPKLCWRLAGVSFYGPYSSWRAGHLDQVILLVWPNDHGIVSAAQTLVKNCIAYAYIYMCIYL